MTKIVIKECRCQKGTKKTYIQVGDENPVRSKTVTKCEGCEDEFFPNKITEGRWIFAKDGKICAFTHIVMKTGGLFLYEEKRV